MQYMPYPAPRPSANLLTDDTSPSSLPHFFVDCPHQSIYLQHPSYVLVEECVQLCLIIAGHYSSLASIE